MKEIFCSPELQNRIDSREKPQQSPWYIQTVIFLAGLLSVIFLVGAVALLFMDDDVFFPLGVVLTGAVVVGYYYFPKNSSYLQAVLFALLAAAQGMLFWKLHETSVGTVALIIVNGILFFVMPLFTVRLLIPGVVMLLALWMIRSGDYSFGAESRMVGSQVLTLISLIYTGILVVTYRYGVLCSEKVFGTIDSVRAGLLLAVLCAWHPVNLAESILQLNPAEPLWQQDTFVLMTGALLIYGIVLFPLFRTFYPEGKPERTIVVLFFLISVLFGLFSVRMMLALQLVCIAQIRQDKKMLAMASLFLLAALIALYYSLHITLLAKSIAMMLTGVVSLLLWRLNRKREGSVWIEKTI